MRGMIKGAKIAGFTAAMALMMNASAYAGGIYEPEVSLKGEPASARRCSLSANVALTTDYVFRGVSQTDENAAIQGGFDAECGRFYGGIWASSLDFGGATTPNGSTVDVANLEIDYFLGVKTTIPNTPIEIDVGAIYYTYPNSFDPGLELDYWELKVGASATVIPNLLTAGLTVFYSPEYTGETGENWVFEGTTELSLPQVAIFTPAISGTVGYQEGDTGNAPAAGIDYWYWNVGLSLAFLEKFSLDVRYWDTDLQGAGNTCSGRTILQCDERFVATLSASF